MTEGRDGLSRYVVSAGSGLLGLQVGSTILAFLISVLLARLLGVTAYGVYAYAMAWVAVLGVVSVFGVDRLVVREVAALRAADGWALVRGLIRRANQLTLAGSLALAAVAMAATFLLTRDPTLRAGLVIAFAMLPPLALSRVRQGALEGMERPVLARAPDTLARPLVLGTLLVGVALLGGSMDAPRALTLTWLAVALSLIAVEIAFRRRMPRALWESPPAFRTVSWVGSALPMFAIGGIQIILSRTDVVMLGALAGTREAGIYNVATSGADLVTFVLLAAGGALAPVFARLHAAGRIRELQDITVRVTRTVFLLSVFPAVLLVLLGGWFLRLFGEGFVDGHGALAILSLSQLFSVGAGPVALLLTMTGNERPAAVGLGVGAVVNLVLNLALIPSFGMKGAAVATGVSLITWNTLLVQLVRSRLGLKPTAFARAGGARA